jgi:hypothetical protein
MKAQDVLKTLMGNSGCALFIWNIRHSNGIETKRQQNLAKHGIDFPIAAQALTQPHAEKRSDPNGDVRILATCRQLSV